MFTEKELNAIVIALTHYKNTQVLAPFRDGWEDLVVKANLLRGHETRDGLLYKVS